MLHDNDTFPQEFAGSDEFNPALGQQSESNHWQHTEDSEERNDAQLVVATELDPATAEYNIGEVVGVVMGGDLSEGTVDILAAQYEEFRQKNDEAVKVGLYGHDLRAAFENENAMLLAFQQKDGVKAYMPLLVPAEDLEWYNMDLLRRSYGEDTKFYYYAHPPVDPTDKATVDVMANTLSAITDRGDVIFTDEYESQPLDILQTISNNEHLSWESMGNDDKERNGQVFVAEAHFSAEPIVRRAESITEAYRRSVLNGEIIEDTQNGVSVAEVIVADEADKVWDLYKNPFDDLTTDHPMSAGFDKETLLEILADPQVAKVVNRVDGDITTLLFFQQNFDLSPWFNKQYYQENFPEYYDTDNIFIFPGIVTDENRRGMGYAQDVIDMATTLMAKRGTDMLLTFECTEISATYIPDLVTLAITSNGLANIAPIEKPISKTNYRVLTKR